MTHLKRLSPAAIVAVLTLLLLSLQAAAQLDAQRGDPGVIVRPSALRQEPSSDADIKASLNLGARVQVTRFRGRWARVAAAGLGQGWIPAANVRLNRDQSKSSGALTGFLRRITGAVSTAPSSSEGSAHMGIRGLEPNDVANARPDRAELQKLNTYRATRPMAERHARDVNLASRSMAYADSINTSRHRSTSPSTPSDRH